MEEVLRQLLLLQQYDIKTREHRQQLAALPKEMAQAKAKLAEGKRYGEELQETLLKKQAQEQNLEMEQKQLAEKRIQLRQKFANAKNQMQAQAGEREVNGLLGREEQLENQQIALLYSIDELRKEMNLQALTLHSLQTECDRQMDYVRKRNLLLQKELADSQCKAEAIAASLPKRALEHYYYTRQSVAHGLYLVPLEGNKCTGCHMHLPDSVLQEVRQSQEPKVCCDFCRRILYLPREEAGMPF